MSKLEIAKQLARQMSEQESYTEASAKTQEQEIPIEKEMLNLFQATGKILILVSKISNEQMVQADQLKRLQADHRREIRILLTAFALPLLLSMITLAILIISQ